MVAKPGPDYFADFCSESNECFRFETLLADLSSRFVNVPADRVDDEIGHAQRAICECLGLQHSTVWQALQEDPSNFEMTHAIRDPGLQPLPARMLARDSFPWVLSKLLLKEVLAISNTAEAPAGAVRDMESWRQYGIKSTLIIPLAAGGVLFGALTFEDTQEQRVWPDAGQNRLRVITDVFANALARKRTEQKLRQSEARLRLAAASANAALWAWNPEKGHLWATAKNNELLGLPRDQNLTFEGFLGVVHPEDREPTRRMIDEAIRAGKEMRAEYRVIWPDGSVRWIESRGRWQSGRYGEPDQLMGVSIDITQAKQVQLELADLRERLQAESDYLKDEIEVGGNFADMIGQGKELKKVFEQIKSVSPTDSAVLIMGETGTGKELVARAIHNNSRRKDRVMVKVDCASLPPSLVESELFGREKGAYTGALTKQVGRFEVANGSTLFLDEIGELPLELQAKLLRVVQDGQFEHLGSPTTINVDVRIVAATNRNLAESVKNGSFREDLYFRLNVFPIHVPPLRDRTEDIPLLVWAFTRELERKMGKKIESIPRKTMEMLQRYPWPGNVRELRNTVEQALIVASGSQLNLQIPGPRKTTLLPTLKGVERDHILAVLEKTGWRVKGSGGAAELLGMKPTTLYTAMERLGIPSKRKKYDIPT